MSERNIYKDVLFGVAVGDALGVPVEFRSREELRKEPVTDMRGYGTHQQPPGTWSDDSSLTFCLAEALTEGFDLSTIGQNFVRWHRKGFWSAHGKIFDIGGITWRALSRIQSGVDPEVAGDDGDWSNGNGSLMRILPLLFHIADMPAEERYRLTRQVSGLTHRHVRSVISCFIFLEFARYIARGTDKSEAYKSLRTVTASQLGSFRISDVETGHFSRILKGNIHDLPEEKIRSSGYVVDTLEAAIWCLMKTRSYSAAVLQAVNLGRDTDTTAAVTGGLAGLLYGHETIPEEWMDVLARRKDIINLAERLELRQPGSRDLQNE
ncbi:MAG: ADP-ribosylglycohydrolase family protein [Bacteroidales bacterium]|nr:ADP-ribosylglycohydrolase family protein [Bacteroidales bacterium]